MSPVARFPRSPADLSPWLLLACVALTAGQAVAVPAPAPTPRDELLRFVPENTGFCVIFQGLRTHWAALQADPLGSHLLRALQGAVLSDAEQKKLDSIKTKLLDPLGLDWEQLRDDVFGEALIFAYRPGPPGNPEQEQGLVLLRVQNAKTLADLIERFNQSQKAAKLLESLEPRVHNGLTYYRRKDVKETSYYYVRGPILLLTSQEKLLQQALDCDRTLPAMAEPPLAARLRQLGLNGALLAFWFNPRPFDPFVQAKADQPHATHAGIHKTVALYWKALDDLALSVALDKELSVRLAVRARLADLPEAMQKYLNDAAKPSDLWRYFPDNALVAMAGRSNGAALLKALNEFLPEGSRTTLSADLNRTLGEPLAKNFVRDVLPSLGPDFGFCLTAPTKKEEGPFPQFLFALRATEGSDPKSPVDKAMLEAVRFLATLAKITHNQQNPERRIDLDKMVVDRREIHFLSGDKVFPAGVQPAFALHDGYMLFASLPDAIRRFGPARPASAEKTGSVPLLRVSVVAWRTYLEERRDDIVKAVAAKNELTREEVEQRLDRFRKGLEFIDRIEVRQQTGRDQVTLTLAVVPAQPPRK